MSRASSTNMTEATPRASTTTYAASDAASFKSTNSMKKSLAQVFSRTLVQDLPSVDRRAKKSAKHVNPEPFYAATATYMSSK